MPLYEFKLLPYARQLAAVHDHGTSLATHALAGRTRGGERYIICRVVSFLVELLSFQANRSWVA
jgi:hypothetical protein